MDAICGKISAAKGGYGTEAKVTRFLYWNTNRKPLTNAIRTLARAHEVDVLILSEFSSSPASMLESLNAGARANFQFAYGLCERIRIFT